MEDEKINLTEKILKHLSTKPKGLSHNDLCSSIEGTNEEITQAINKLIENHRINVNQTKTEIIYRFQSEKDAFKIKNLSIEELETYFRITESDNAGVTTNDIKMKTNINTQILNKILKKLEKNLLIKSWNVANMRNKKVNFTK